VSFIIVGVGDEDFDDIIIPESDEQVISQKSALRSFLSTFSNELIFEKSHVLLKGSISF